MDQQAIKFVVKFFDLIKILKIYILCLILNIKIITILIFLFYNKKEKKNIIILIIILNNEIF